MHAVKDPTLCPETTHTHMLLQYVHGAQQTVQSIDQLGNFLMGFGVLALGYLLNQDLGVATRALGVGPAGQQVSGLLTLGAWGLGVGLLVCFVYTYVFKVIAGRAVHGRDGTESDVGEVLDLPEDPTFEQFIRPQRTFRAFLKNSYRGRDQNDPEALLYARWTYMRFMAVKKLQEMQRMRHLLGMALIAGVTFKVLLVYQAALMT